MMRIALVLAAALAVTAAYAKDERQLTAQQQRMVDCNKDASADHLKGDERQAFMSKCLRGDKGGDRLTAQQEKMKTCNRTAGERDLKGDARSDFMRKCLSGDSAAAGSSAPEKTSSQQDRMTSCNHTASDRDLKGKQREEFMRHCLSGDSGVAERRDADRQHRAAAKNDQQERMVACNRQGRDKKLHGAERKEFIRDCLKGETSAAGGRR